MAVTILRGVLSVATGIQTPFNAKDGVEPYVFSVISGGAGGTINSSTGLYTAPNEAGSGVDVIRVTDNSGAYSEASINIMTHLGLLCDILQQELGLADGQVYIYNQKFNIPKDNELYISVGVLSMKPFSNISKFIDDLAGLRQVQSTNIKMVLSIDIQSKGTEAFNRKEEVIMAFNGYFSKSIQEANNFSVAVIPSAFVNLSNVDGSRIPYHYNLTISMQYMVKKESMVQYYDTFNDVEITTNK